MAESIVKKDITDELSDSFISYALKTITERAIPDIRDGLKPSHRRILLAMRDLKLSSKAKYRKAALTVSGAIGTYHPHSDQAVYSTMVRMAQPFSLRYPLIDGQGNFGNVGGSPAAAMRYTEARMSVVSDDLLEDISIDSKWTVPITRNYDETRDEPTVLPSKFPNLLTNGVEGIAVGWASTIFPNNIKEICAALIAVVKKPQLTNDELLQIVKGPDFPTGGIIHGTDGIKDLYTTGSGRLVVTGRVKIDSKKGGISTITVYELPYGVGTDLFLEKADAAFKKGDLSGISHLKDASSERMGNPVQVIFYLKRGEDPQVVLNQLYEHTPLREILNGNMIALVEGKDGERIPSKSPLSLRTLMDQWLDFRREVILKKTGIQLETTKKEILRLTALLIATDPANIDKVINILKSGEDEEQVIKKLMAELNLSENQVKDVLEITLRRLMKLERASLQKQLDNKKVFASECEAILKDKKLVNEIIIRELEEIDKNYGDNRLTSIEGEMKKVETIDLVADEPVIVMMTNTGYIKRGPIDSYRKTARGSKGVTGAITEEDDYVINVFQASTHDWLLAFTNLGNVYWLKVFDIPETAKATKGRALVNLIKIKSGEKVNSIIPVAGNFDENREIVFGTANGTVKKTKLSEYGNPRTNGVAAIKLREDDYLISATLVDKDDHILFVTEHGKVNRFDEKELGSQARNTSGKRGIKLKEENDKVCAVLTVKPNDNRHLLTFTKGGLGKRTLITEYEQKSCGASGVLTTIITDPNSHLATVTPVSESDEVVIVSDSGKTVRLAAKDIRISDRRTRGVKLINLESNQKVVSAAVIRNI